MSNLYIQQREILKKRRERTLNNMQNIVRSNIIPNEKKYNPVMEINIKKKKYSPIMEANIKEECGSVIEINTKKEEQNIKKKEIIKPTITYFNRRNRIDRKTVAPNIDTTAIFYTKEEFYKYFESKKINYNTIMNGAIVTIEKNKPYINLMLAVQGRKNNFETCIRYLKYAIKECVYKVENEYDRLIKITVLENDIVPKYQQFCKNNNYDYVFLPMSLSQSKNKFAKSLLWNLGFIFANSSPWYCLHDIDIIMESNFFELITTNYINTNKLWIQPYNDKVVKRFEIKETINIIKTNKYLELDKIPCKNPLPGSVGGSIFVKRKAFLDVGGFDPELYSGYAPEDAMFWAKLECSWGISHSGSNTHLGGACYADNPSITLYHLDHPFVLNPEQRRYMGIYNAFVAMNHTEKIEYMKLKRNILIQYIKE